MRALALIVVLISGLAVYGAELSDPVLVIPNQTSSSGIRFSVSIGDQSAFQVWTDFLEHWKATFDTDHDGQLNPQEAQIVPALTNAANSTIRLDPKSSASTEIIF